jgi:hypothetical protein
VNILKRFFSSPEKQFWSWFEANSSRLFSVEHGRETILTVLNATLAKVDPGLTYEFGPTEGGQRQFAISAGGIKDVFPAVERLVAAVPKLSNWKVIAFIPRRSPDLQLKIGGVEIGPDDVWFRLERDGVKVGILLYLDKFEDPTSPPSVQATFVMLDGALGEYDVETKVGFIKRYRLPSNPVGKDLQPFRELPEAFDKLFASLVN